MLQGLSFLLVLKIDRSGGGDGVFLCKDFEEVENTLAKLSEKAKTGLVIQEYIEGDIVCVEAIFKKGTLLAYSFSVVTKTITTPFSTSIQRVYKNGSPIEASLLSIGKSLGIHGFSSMTFIYNAAQDTYFLIEADLRPQIWFSLSRFDGVDFSLAIMAFLEKDSEASPLQTIYRRDESKKEVVITHFTRSISKAIAHHDFREVIRWIGNKEERWSYAGAYDGKLFLSFCAKLGKEVWEHAIYIGKMRLNRLLL